MGRLASPDKVRPGKPNDGSRPSSYRTVTHAGAWQINAAERPIVPHPGQGTMLPSGGLLTQLLVEPLFELLTGRDIPLVGPVGDLFPLVEGREGELDALAV